MSKTTKQDHDNELIDIMPSKVILSDQKLQMSAGDGTSQGTFGDPNPDDRFSFNIPDHFLGTHLPLGDLSANN